MNTFGVVLCFAVCLCVIQTAMAGCRFTCWPCGGGGLCCGVRCSFRKRDVSSSSILPCQFSAYDTDKDNYIDMMELQDGLKEHVKTNQIKAIFYIMDTDPTDQLVNEEEFKHGPLYKENC